MGRDSANEMLTVLLDDPAELVPLKRVIIERTEGDPFFTEEIVQALFERGVLMYKGIVKLAKSRDEIRVLNGPRQF